MNTTTIDHDEMADGSGRSPRQVRRLACIGLALITSAGIGAVIGSTSASTATRPPAHVSAADSKCTSTAPPTGIVLLAFQASKTKCTEAPMLVRATANE